MPTVTGTSIAGSTRRRNCMPPGPHDVATHISPAAGRSSSKPADISSKRDRRRKRRADEGGAGQAMPQHRAEHVSQQHGQGDEPAGHDQPFGRARAGADAEVEHDERAGQTRQRQRRRRRRPPGMGNRIGAASDELIDVQIDVDRVLHDGREPDRQDDERGEQRQRLAHGLRRPADRAARRRRRATAEPTPCSPSWTAPRAPAR